MYSTFCHHISVHCCPILHHHIFKEGESEVQARVLGKGGHVKMEAEPGVMQLPTKHLQGMPEPLGAGKRKGTMLP